MINLVDYQKTAVEQLTKAYKELLYSGNGSTQLVFKSPTGSGKTVMVASLLDEILREKLPDDTVFIWASMNKLHIQSRNKLAGQYLPDSEYHLMLLEDLEDDSLETNTILFCNWESLFKTKTNAENGEISWGNTYVRIGEDGRNLQNVMEKTRTAGKRVVLIVDEAHRTYLGKNSQRLVDEIIRPDLTLEVSATPLLEPKASDVSGGKARWVEIGFEDVSSSGLIKNEAVINNRVSETVIDGSSTDLVVLEASLRQREELATKYSEQGSAVKPLILIQLPSESDKLSEADEDVRTRVENLLADKGITYENKKLAIWLSSDKTNKDLVEIEDSPVEVLIFKQAIATGWDCPRAQVLVMLRDIKSVTFEIQTIGRIMRMPELKHYTDEALNTAYIFTNINKPRISDTEDAQTYFRTQLSKLRGDIQNITLPDSWYSIRNNRRRLGGNFRDILLQKLDERFGIVDSDSQDVRRGKVDNLLQIYPEELTIPILSDVVLANLDDIDQKLFSDGITADFVADKAFIQREFDTILRSWVSPYAPHDSVPVLRGALYKWFDQSGFSDEAEVQRIITCADETKSDANQRQLTEVIVEAKQDYGRDTGESRDFLRQDFVVPASREFGENYEIAGGTKHALFPHYREKKPYKTELDFEQYIDAADSVEWWFRNGYGEPKYFAVNKPELINTDEIEDNFYPDYIIKFKDGRIGIFDTKAGFTAENEKAKYKSDALQAYVREHSGLPLFGGLVIPKSGGWLIQQDLDYDNDDSSKWQPFVI